MSSVRSTAPRARLTVAAAAVGVVAFPALTAGAAASTTPAAGTSTSQLSLVKVTSGDTSVAAGVVDLTTSTTGAASAAISVTPVTSSVTGDAGTVTVTPSTSPRTVAGGTIALPGGLGSLTGPAMNVTAATPATGPVATAAASALGSITLLGQPFDLGVAALSDTSKVTANAATASKSLTVGSVGLPSIADLLAGLGLDLSKLDQSQLNGLVGVLGTTISSTLSSTIATLNSQIDSLQATLGASVANPLDTVGAVTAAQAADQAALTGSQATLAAAQSTLTTATSAFDTAFAGVPGGLAAINAALTVASLPTIGGSPTLDYTLWTQLTSAQQALIDTLTAADLASLASAVAVAQAAVDTAQATVDAAQTTLNDVTSLLDGLLSLVTNVTSALDADPLAVLGQVKLSTSAVASGSPTADASAVIGSLDVLGTSHDVSAGVGAVDSALAAVTAPLSNVLNGIAGVSFTAPSVAVGAVSRSTGTSGVFKTAQADVAAVMITLPRLTLPSALALPSADGLAWLTSTATGFVSSPGVVAIGVLGETATYRPATSSDTTNGGTPNGGPPNGGTPTGTTNGGTPTASGSPLPRTGAGVLLPVVALALLGAAYGVRRLRQVGESTG